MKSKPTKQNLTSQRTRGNVDWADAFLSALEETGVISQACESASINRVTVWQRRQTDREFASRYEESLRAGAFLLEAEAVRRARDGVVRMKFNPRTGTPYIDPRTITPECPEGLPYMEHEYSDTLLALLLRRHIPEYREPKGEVHVSTAVHNHQPISPERLKQLRERHAKALAAVGVSGSSNQRLTQ